MKRLTSIHRAKRAIAVLVGSLLAVGVAGTAIAVSSGPTPKSDPSLQAAPAVASTVDPAVSSQLSVLTRPRVAADALPAVARSVLQETYQQDGPNYDNARKVTASNGKDAYLVPANGGACAVSGDQALCAQAPDVPGADIVHLCGPRVPIGEAEIEWMMPDNATDVALVSAEGTKTSLARGYNVYIADVPLSGKLPRTIQWNTGSVRHTIDAGMPPDAASQGCEHPPAGIQPAAQPSSSGPSIVRDRSQR